MQEAFQFGFETEFGKCEETILPEKDINDSLNAKGAEAYLAIADGTSCGGTVINIDADAHHGHLDLLFVNIDQQRSGIGYAIWKALEDMHPEIDVWETCTPYFEKRNIHFYVNKCGFHIVEFYGPFHRDPNSPEGVGGMPAEQGDYMFKFEKNMIR